MHSRRSPRRGGRSTEATLMTQFMRYLPLLLGLVTHLPGFLAGLALVCLYFAIVGRDALKHEYAPVAGFHVAALLLLRELVKPWREGKAQAAAVRQRLASQRTLADEVQLQWRATLD
ncbi:uncharacterized protein Tco025E_02256 [Trypanosoma conorhini]|uniref:Uncharacterized protein n=1 Tax=Trypanosoma conorhini TaxID=83891 RepID=A0A3R7LCF2_9TRYP|nr:uncharacterized protein Tco025E_02256 [Trypanosoma conorhini]RNF25576.1 hypothetical protein Tco025E_02256 [Trypanosoma conorhini]